LIELRNKEEVSVDVQVELLVQSLGWSCFNLIDINNLPFLVETVLVDPLPNLIGFFILSVFDRQNLLVQNILDSTVGELEDLPPLRGNSTDDDLVCIPVGLEMETLCSCGSRSNGSRDPVKVPSLS
jgi:hypothetical protein